MVAHGTPCLGPGHARRLRRALPRLRPRLLRLLRADGDARTRAALSALDGASSARTSATSCASTAASTPAPSRSARRARRMSRRLSAHDQQVDYLARVEGEGAMHVELDGDEVDDVQLRDLRAAALLRGVPARPRVHRGARHHRAHLRHLPGRLPDERRARDGGRAAASRSTTGRCATCGGCSTAASGSRATRCTSTCCTRPTSSATRAPSRWRATTARSSSAGCR